MVFLLLYFIMFTSINNGCQSTNLKENALFKGDAEENVYTYVLNISKVVHKCNKDFLGFSIDSNEIKKGLKNPTLRNPALIRLVSYLSPGYLRIGGIEADNLIFKDENAALTWSSNLKKTFYMSERQWLALCEFAKSTGFKILFGLNVLLRKGYNWDYTNAKSLLDFTASQGVNISWQLGNEPNDFFHEFNKTVSPAQLAKDFSVLRSLVHSYPVFQQSLLIGPDTTSPHTDVEFMPPERFLQKFNVSGGVKVVDAVGWHHYYLHGNTTKKDFLDPKTFDSLLVGIVKMKESIKGSGKSHWITESGSAVGGGMAGASDRFMASFLLLDRLGLAAREGVDTVIRQSLYSGHYALIDRLTLTPNPDWWVSYIYKKLVASTVLSVVPPSTAVPPTLRLYAQCSNNGSAVVFGMNLNNFTEQIVINVTSFRLPISARFYQLTSPDLLSRTVYLNGEPLRMHHDVPPPLSGVVVSTGEPLPIAGHAIFFLHFYTLHSTECL